MCSWLPDCKHKTVRQSLAQSYFSILIKGRTTGASRGYTEYFLLSDETELRPLKVFTIRRMRLDVLELY